ncbi:sensor histidine kinase [Psychroserpens sp.]|uniref:sensor histidine kinase n=1 Tax=Psychroserpens sp. TaxID=2020870 RepID=UPI001B20D53F|nr:ATP-binding protein [Psychroserpens sp.]MBO6606676.1 GHKL domain-containing protein [Psychroserpens sp.]MBO6653380.1 GHKL domain-containing protein [Psychroserpens sp.]MBO6680593.1 GHKL domain-containing protein [Psychroserpens sp.]MBO6750449.1 GHKL domain-containing protein [Psychroserpens sp.]MBO6914931.1 GHKL domain-containing protein [Psychroserpens sp.]
MKTNYLKNTSLIIGSLLLLIVFVIDVFVPLGVAVGVFYVCCIALLIREEKRSLLVLSIVATLLIAVVPFLTITPETKWMAFVNRGISIVAVWVVYIIAVRHTTLDNELKKYTSRLEYQNSALKQFTYVASHDLQEPLRTVSNFVELLRQQYQGKLDENADHYLRFISEASTRMSELVKGLLDHSRIGGDKELVTVDCNKLLEAIQKDLAAAITETNTSFNIGELPQLKGYKTELRLLFQNLISNAIKFCKPGTTPEINISAKEENGWTFTIRDNGIGIADNHKEKIFLIFQRLHNKNDYEGTGIGLAHCQKIIELHGGKIWVDSQPNKGSTFYFNIPN